MKSLKAYISILKEVKNRPTKFFLYLVLIIIGLFMQAYMHNYNIVYLMMFFLVGVAGAGSLYGVYNLYYIKAKLLSQDRFFAHESASYTLSISNESSNIAYDINVLVEEQLKNIQSIKPYDSATITLNTRFFKRGKTKLPKIELNSLFPLPHEIKYKSLHIDDSLLVYAQAKGISLFDFYNIDESTNGEISEFDGIKDFIQGENISLIHWASLAKSDSLKSKKFLYEESQKSLHFDFESLSGDFEAKLSQLTLWILECERYNFDFILTLKHLTLDSKEHSFDEVLQTIATY